MSSIFRITVRYLQPLAHGRADGGDPEWPPSPLRVFQALVAASAARWNERMQLSYAVPALKWLERQKNPTIVAVGGTPSRTPYRLYVPDNVGDKVAKSWRLGNDASIAEHRTEKDVRPTHLSGEAVHYLYPLPENLAEFETHRGTLRDAARSITHLGWGVDMVVGDASLISDEEAAKLPGERWHTQEDPSPVALRVPIAGTLNDLTTKHTAFLNRLSADGFKPVPPLSVFRVVGYRRSTDPAPRPFAAFSILKPDASGNRAFDTVRRTRDVAAWLRFATGQVCNGWPFGPTEGFVHGHDGPNKPLKGERADQRFMYLPLPTINYKLKRVESIRRVLIAAPPGFQDRIDWVRRRLSGQELLSDGEPVGLLTILPKTDWVLRQYWEESQSWSTVTPVIWPGHDDCNSRKAEAILRKAFVQAGLAKEIVEGIQELEWRPVGFRAGLDLAHRYACPENLKGRRYHVRVRFRHPIPGPLALGAGRYRGLGLFVRDS